MEQPGKLHDLFDTHNSESNDPGLDWSEMGGAINSALDQKEEKRRRFFWWLFGTGALIGIVSIFLFYPSTEGKDSYSSAREDTETITSTSAESADMPIQSSQSEAVDVKMSPAITQQGDDTQGLTSDADRVTRQARAKTEQAPRENREEATEIGADNLKIISPSAPISDTGRVVSTEGRDEFFTDVITATEPVDIAYKDERSSPLIALLKSRKIMTAKRKNILGGYVLEPLSTFVGAGLADNLTTMYIYTGLTTNDLRYQYSHNKALVGTSIEAGVIVPLGYGLSLSAGVGVDQHRFQTEFVETTDIQVYQPETADTIFYFGSSVEVVYSDSVAGIGTRAFGYTNTVTNVNIPFDIGYAFTIGKISVMPQLGIGFTLHQRTDMNTANQLFDLQRRSATRSFSLAPRVRGLLAIRWPVTPQFSLSARYAVTRQTLHAGQSIDRVGYTSQGLQFGVVYSWE